MRRISRGAVLATGVVMAVAGCGSTRATPPRAKEWSKASLTAAVLSPRDVPRGFLPAQAQAAFAGVVPTDPDCRRLLTLADAYGLRDVPRVAAAFYQAAPGATISQQVLHLGAVEAQAQLTALRQARAACRFMVADVGGSGLRLKRVPLRLSRTAAHDAVAVSYEQSASKNYKISYEIVMARVGDDLLVVANPGVVHKRVRNMILITATCAVAKLVAAQKAGLTTGVNPLRR